MAGRCAAAYFAATTFACCSPRPSTPRRTTSPGFSHFGFSFMPWATHLTPYYDTESRITREMTMSMTIAHAARTAGVGVETIRFYQRRGLIRQPRKPASGFREYDAETVAGIRFIRQAQELGFSLQEIKGLLSLRANPKTDCAAVRARATKKRDEVEQKIVQLGRLRSALDTLIASCPGSGALRACTILDAIEQAPAAKSERKLRRISRSRHTSANAPRGGLRAMKTAKFTIKGMNCDGCAQTIESVVGREGGVRKVEVSFATGEARVLYDPQAVTEDALAAAIKKLGFGAKAQVS